MKESQNRMKKAQEKLLESSVRQLLNAQWAEGGSK